MWLSRLLVMLIVFALCIPAEAQQPAKIARIGYLTGAHLTAIPARIEALRQGLRDLGYVEGKNLAIEFRWAEVKFERLSAFAAELVGLKVDVIVTVGASATRATKEATKTIPIVMAQESDPEGSGFIASLAHPGGNITGLSTLFPGSQRKKTGVFEGDRPQTFAGRRFWDVGQGRGCLGGISQTDRTRRRGIQSAASILRLARE